MAGTNSLLAARQFTAVCDILDRFDRNPEKLIPILQTIQEEYRYLPEEVMTYIATALEISPARVFGIATFYGQFSLEPKGKYILRCCDGTACHVRGSEKMLDAMYAKLGLSAKKKTTTDMLFTVETVSCLGACGLAPVLMINEDVHGQVTPEMACELIDQIIAQEEQC